MKQKIIKAGNSLAVTIPSNFVKTVGVKLADEVEVESKPETGELIYTFKGSRQLSLASISVSKNK